MIEHKTYQALQALAAQVGMTVQVEVFGNGVFAEKGGEQVFKGSAGEAAEFLAEEVSSAAA